MTVHRASPADLLALSIFSLKGQRYLMPDHGLFVAGIISTIASGAELHLFEVLSPYGVGSIETIAKGMHDADSLPRAAGVHLIINCSLQMVLDPNASPNVLTYGHQTLREICDLLDQNNVTIVAAAGNTVPLIPAAPRQPPCYPAAYPSVIAAGSLKNVQAALVGAVLDKPDFEAAPYSNTVTKNGPGYLTYGGEAPPEQGMLGVYLGNVLNGGYQHNPLKQGYKHNPSGWARWCGK